MEYSSGHYIKRTEINDTEGVQSSFQKKNLLKLHKDATKFIGPLDGTDKVGQRRMLLMLPVKLLSGNEAV